MSEQLLRVAAVCLTYYNVSRNPIIQARDCLCTPMPSRNYGKVDDDTELKLVTFGLKAVAMLVNSLRWPRQR